MALYSFIERSFFFTLNRKIAGNMLFIGIFFGLALWMAYPANGDATLWWLLLLSGTVAFLFTGFYLRHLIVRPVQALVGTLHESNRQGADLSQRLPAFTFDEFRTLSEEFNHFVGQLSEVLTKVHVQASDNHQINEKVSDAVKQTRRNLQDTEHRNQQIRKDSDEVIEYLARIVQSSDQMGQVTNLAADKAKIASGQMQQLNRQLAAIAGLLDSFGATINGLQKNSENVRQILVMVEGFSDQTNLLALNAAIEAARAGDAGRGFAVVADEVRSLAGRTQQATSEIRQMIEHLQQQSQQAVTAVLTGKQEAEQCVTTMTELVASLTAVTEAISATLRISSAVNQASQSQQQLGQAINDRMHEIVGLAQQSATQAEQTMSESQEVARLAQQLTEGAARFKI